MQLPPFVPKHKWHNHSSRPTTNPISTLIRFHSISLLEIESFPSGFTGTSPGQSGVIRGPHNPLLPQKRSAEKVWIWFPVGILSSNPLYERFKNPRNSGSKAKWEFYHSVGSLRDLATPAATSYRRTTEFAVSEHCWTGWVQSKLWVVQFQLEFFHGICCLRSQWWWIHLVLYIFTSFISRPSLVTDTTSSYGDGPDAIPDTATL